MYKKINGEKMKISKSTKIIFSVSCILGLVVAFSGNFFMGNKKNTEIQSLLSISASRVISPIYIDDLDPENNWETFILANPWCIGTGEPGNPYIIYGVSIDANGSQYCVVIKNSNKLFQIDNGFFFNTSQYEISAGIYLSNVSNGYLLNSEFSNNGFFGIEVINSSYLTILRNYFHNNGAMGIYYGSVQNSSILENDINNHGGNGIELYNSKGISAIRNDIISSDYYGILLDRTNNSQISNNLISQNTDGIALIKSNGNSITNNTISNISESGILIQIYSHNNTISNNIISNALYCILIGNSSHGTNLFNNDPCTIRSFDDIPLPDPPSNGTINDESDERLGIPGYNAIFFVSITFAIIISTTMANKRMKTIRDSQNHKEF
ncbi:hypothetical protein LCGC14_2405360 [marine sediment metagenome]|uniref:Periplasmic copper-binding protein NosD beta helix domain-containing protein n=1 Tax=marine sediment metagenome TaxID=412755 RepID=A0A0F9CG52_9ZZZZ